MSTPSGVRVGNGGAGQGLWTVRGGGGLGSSAPRDLSFTAFPTACRPPSGQAVNADTVSRFSMHRGSTCAERFFGRDGGCGGGSRVPSARAIGAERELPPNPATWEDIGEHLWRRVDIIAATHLLYLNEPSCSFAPALAGVLVTEPSKGTRNEKWNSSRIQGAGAIDDDDGTPSSLPLHALLFRVADQSTPNMAINEGASLCLLPAGGSR